MDISHSSFQFSFPKTDRCSFMIHLAAIDLSDPRNWRVCFATLETSVEWWRCWAAESCPTWCWISDFGKTWWLEIQNLEDASKARQVTIPTWICWRCFLNMCENRHRTDKLIGWMQAITLNISSHSIHKCKPLFSSVYLCVFLISLYACTRRSTTVVP